MLRIATALMFGIVALAVSGCVLHPRSRHPHGVPPGQAKKAVVTSGHVCGAACDHYRVGGVWYVSGHRHVHGCGHQLVGGKWIVGVKTPGPSKIPPGQLKLKGKKK